MGLAQLLPVADETQHDACHPVTQRIDAHYKQADTLRSHRMIVLRSGGHILSDQEVAAFICEQPDVLARTLPVIEQWGFAARDDDGALYSPHLLARELRRQDRARRRAERDEALRRFEAAQAAGEIAPDATLRGMTAKINGSRGGRPRKEETAEQARIRRAQEADAAQRQRRMPLMRSLPGAETQNPNQKPKPVSVFGVSVSGTGFSVPLDIGIDSDINLNPTSTPDEPENPAAQTEQPVQAVTVSPEVLATTVERVIEVAGFTLGKRNQYPAVRKWLAQGCPPELLIEAVRMHRATMDSAPEHMGAFQAAIRSAWEQSLINAPEPAPQREIPAWETQARTDLAADQRAFAVFFEENRDYGQARRRWAEEAARLGRPTADLKLDAYLNAYRPAEQAA
ncbi:hypothetical protein [Novacetimonas hansenii]|uniref:hypothetical protein n=1 Tax=Novacetimonas hansenii TaxID=436 RepID=UPI0039EB972B